MANEAVVVEVRLPAESVNRLDEIVEAEGGTRAEVACRLLVKVLAGVETEAILRLETNALLDLDEDIAGP